MTMGNNEYLNRFTDYAKASGAFAYVLKRYQEEGSSISKNDVMAEYAKLKVAYESLKVLRNENPTGERLNDILTIATADFAKANSVIQNLQIREKYLYNY